VAQRLILLLASAGGVGYIPVASGTFGAAVAIPLYCLFEPWRHLSVPLYLIAFVAAVGAACWIAGRAEAILQDHDSHVIVIDEVVGYFAAMLFLAPTWENLLVAFVIFRIFDVIKPFPAGTIDRSMPGGTGVVLDDVVSGFYANLATRAVMALVG
jgi:phosphatidylglycerophosphatase A